MKTGKTLILKDNVFKRYLKQSRAETKSLRRTLERLTKSDKAREAKYNKAETIIRRALKGWTLTEAQDLFDKRIVKKITTRSKIH